jgi:hypothetical protein
MSETPSENNFISKKKTSLSLSPSIEEFESMIRPLSHLHTPTPLQTSTQPHISKAVKDEVKFVKEDVKMSPSLSNSTTNSTTSSSIARSKLQILSSSSNTTTSFEALEERQIKIEEEMIKNAVQGYTAALQNLLKIGKGTGLKFVQKILISW